MGSPRLSLRACARQNNLGFQGSADLMRIGHAGRQYPEQRTILNKIQDAEYVLCRDRYSLVRAARSRLGLKWKLDDEFVFDDWNLNRVDLFHFFNHVSFARTPWVSTFETFLPRVPAAFDAWAARASQSNAPQELIRCLDALAAESCKQVVAISEAAARIQREFLGLFPDYRERIVPKISVLHPPQAVRSHDHALHDPQTPVRFAMIGHHFFRKGGRQVLETMERWVERHPGTLSLTLVSRREIDSFANAADRLFAENFPAFLERNRHWIDYHRSLPAAEVESLMRATDVGLLPSLSETYGYTVLEFQSLGVPVVTTNIRAFPEINSNDCGWVVPLQLNDVGDAKATTREDSDENREVLRLGLHEVLQHILGAPHSIAEKGVRARERVRLSHDPSAYGASLSTIYRDALGS